MDNTNKFTGLANVYAASRPSYAPELYNYLYDLYGFQPSSKIADIGHGTGKFAKPLLERGSFVFAVEPNDDMREAAHKTLSVYENITFVNGTDVATTLENGSVDAITVAQAFHWFDANAFKIECQRILKQDGQVVLAWNMRDIKQAANEDTHTIFSKYCNDFKGFSSGITADDPRIQRFFNGDFTMEKIPQPLYFTQEAFIQRCLSASYSLQQGDKHYEAYLAELVELFARHAINGQLEIANHTVAFIGKVDT